MTLAARDRALDLLRSVADGAGFRAAPDRSDDYANVWARDGVVCGLAAVLTDEDELIAALGRTLATLRDNRGPHGEIPSNVSPDGRVSYGGPVGRVDAPLWYVIGAAALTRHDPGAADAHRQAAGDALWLAGALELNGGGLIWVPPGGCWIDESHLHGYVLNVQLLHAWALRAGSELLDDAALLAESERVLQNIADNLWIDDRDVPRRDPAAYEAARERLGQPRRWLASFGPHGYDDSFDGLGNALALLLGLPNARDVASVVDDVARRTGSGLLPSLDPPVAPGDARWDAMASAHTRGFRNRPGDYHNGGLWPMPTGFAAAGFAVAGMPDRSAALARAIDDANGARNGGFYEYHGVRSGPGGTRNTAWSAAAAIVARHAAQAGPPRWPGLPSHSMPAASASVIS